MLAQKIAINTIISAASRVLGVALALVTVGLLTRYFSRSEWGDYSIMLTWGGIFGTIAEFGLYQFLIREISKPGADEKKIAGNIFSLRLVFSFFIFLLAPVLSLLLPYSSEARLGIAVGMIGFWLLASSQVLMAVFQKYLRMDKVALAELTGRVVQLVLIYWLIKIEAGFLMIVGAFSLSCLANFLTTSLLVQKYTRVGLRFDVVFWKSALRSSYPIALSSILTMIYFSSDSLMLSILKPSSDVGIYRLSYKILESLIFFPSMFVGLVMPLLSVSAFREWARFKTVFQRSNDVLTIFALPLILGTFVLSPQIIRLLGGSNYPESVGVLNILIVAVGVIFLGTLYSFGLISLERQKDLVWISGAGAAANVILNLVLIPKFSYYAAAATTLFTELLVTVFMAVCIYRVIKFFPSFRIFFKSLGAGLLMMAVLWGFRAHNLAFLVALGGLTYFGFLYLFKGFSWGDIKEILGKNFII